VYSLWISVDLTYMFNSVTNWSPGNHVYLQRLCRLKQFLCSLQRTNISSAQQFLTTNTRNYEIGRCSVARSAGFIYDLL